MIYNDILIGEVEISQFDDYGVYMYVYIYIYIYRMTIVCYGFFKYEWEYDVVPCSIPQ